jgi:hypothetical protein
MAQFKWGGPFSGIDKVARAPVSGSVAGTFDGTFSADQQQTLSALILQGFVDVVAGLPTTLSEATSKLDDLSQRLTQQVTDALSQHGASGQLTIVMVKLR